MPGHLTQVYYTWKSNSKIIYLKVDNTELSPTRLYIRNEDYDEEYFCNETELATDSKSTNKPVEHVLTIDTISQKIIFSIKTVDINQQLSLNEIPEYNYFHKHMDMQSQYAYVPFIETDDDCNVLIHCDQLPESTQNSLA